MRISRPRSSQTRLKPAVLTLEWLEGREVPAITIQIDYSHDTSGFFSSHPAARALLQQAADALAGQISASLPAIVPGGSKTWGELFFDPSTGQQVTVTNPVVAGNTIVVYAGARVLGGGQVSVGGTGGYSASGDQGWLNFLHGRGPGGSNLWGGVVAFDTTTNWWFGSSAAGIGASQVDFLSCATHELAHTLGIGTVPTWFAQVKNGAFTGPHAETIYGGPVPLTWGAGGELNNVTVKGVPPVMNLNLQAGTRVATFTPLDWSLLADIGWSVGGVTVPVPPPASPPVAPPPPPASPPVAPPPPHFTPPLLNSPGLTPVVLTGPTDGSARAFTLGSSGQLVAAGGPVYPFP
ncbi:MAG: repeat protein, partial [Gemmataceae bacterium]|nr:repeat protein [Gemmataceae bacterium]